MMHGFILMQEDYVLLPKALEVLGMVAGGECSVNILCHFATHPMSGERAMVFMTHLL